MNITRYTSGLDKNLQTFFYRKADVLGSFSVERFEAASQSEFVTLDLVQAISKGGSVNAYVFEISGWEQDNRVTRHLAGARTSVFLGKKMVGVKRLYESAEISGSEVSHFGLFQVDSATLSNCLWMLFGLSRSLLFVGSLPSTNCSDLCNATFRAVWHNNAALQTRFAVSGILNFVDKIPTLTMISGYGSEDFGGFFLDAFTNNKGPCST